MSEDERPKETVILVHGTWAAPLEGKHQWYQQIAGLAAEQTFVTKLDDALARHGSTARCWKHCDDQHQPFHWSGENNWLARTAAAVRLSEEIDRLGAAGWKCHLIAHSHGGNIVMEALSSGVCKLRVTQAAGALANIVALGTPYFDVASTIRRVRRFRRIALSIPAVILYLIFLIWGSSLVIEMLKLGIASAHSPSDSLFLKSWFLFIRLRLCFVIMTQRRGHSIAVSPFPSR